MLDAANEEKYSLECNRLPRLDADVQDWMLMCNATVQGRLRSSSSPLLVQSRMVAMKLAATGQLLQKLLYLETLQVEQTRPLAPLGYIVPRGEGPKEKTPSAMLAM